MLVLRCSRCHQRFNTRLPLLCAYANQPRVVAHIHAIGGIVILAASFGHIYMGTLVEEGATDAMMTGYCDENWAKDHHDLWVEELGNPDFETATLDEATRDRTILMLVNIKKA